MQTGKVEGTKMTTTTEQRKMMGEIGCFHVDNQIVMGTSKYEHLQVMGYSKKVLCTLCKMQVGIKE